MPKVRRFPHSAVLILATLTLCACVMSTDHTDPTAEKVLPKLLAVLKDPDPALRQVAAQSLGKIARQEAVPALTEALQDPVPSVRAQAAWALGMIGEKSAAGDHPQLASLLFDSDAAVRQAAATALGQTGATPAALERLEKRLLEPGVSSDTKRLGAAALGAMEARYSVGFLIKLLKDPDATVRRSAVAALAEIGDQQALAPISMLLLTDPDPQARIEAAFRLSKFGGIAALPALASALKDRDANVRRLAEAGLKEADTEK